MKRTDIQQLPQFFDRYILQVEDIELLEGLEKNASLFEDEATQQNYWPLATKCMHLANGLPKILCSISLIPNGLWLIGQCEYRERTPRPCQVSTKIFCR
ncbi:MAG: hypothetical protein R2822_24990 [Spirosomataceae bacterium]